MMRRSPLLSRAAFVLLAVGAACIGAIGCGRETGAKAATTLPTNIAGIRPLRPVKFHAGLPQDSVVNAVSPNMLSARSALVLVKSERDKYWLVAKHEVYKSGLELAAQDETEKLRGLRVPKVLHGPRGRHEIALTFDDGPHPDYTLTLLKILKQNNIHATFFVVGEKAEEYPDLIRAEIAAGDEVGNHTYDHVSLIKIPEDYVATEIKACGDVIQSITHQKPTLFRPPGGEYNQSVADTAGSLGYRMILYSDDPGDYADPGTQVIETRTLDTISDGGIVLFHDGGAQTPVILPQIIQRLKARGFHFVTIGQMLSQEGPTPAEAATPPQGGRVN